MHYGSFDDITEDYFDNDHIQIIINKKHPAYEFIHPKSENYNSYFLNDVMASAMSRYIVQKYVNSTYIDTIENTDTSNAFYKELMKDAAISNFLSGRVWSIGYGQCDHVNIKSNVIPILYFSEKNLTVANGATITVWRYKEGELSKGAV